MQEAVNTIDNQPCKRTSVRGGSGPLIPRASGFNGGIVFDCPRYARAFACAWLRLTAFWLIVVGRCFVACLLRLCLM